MANKMAGKMANKMAGKSNKLNQKYQELNKLFKLFSIIPILPLIFAAFAFGMPFGPSDIYPVHPSYFSNPSNDINDIHSDIHPDIHSNIHPAPVAPANVYTITEQIAERTMPQDNQDSQGQGPMSFDFPPILQFFSDTQHTQTVATLTAVAADTGNNAGIQWIKIYEDGSLFDSKDCQSRSTCTFVKPIIETMHTSHDYYAKTKDLGSNIVQSETITIEFEGINHLPQIDDFTPENLTPEVNVSDTLHFEVWASDIDGDSLSYSWELDGSQVSTFSSWDYQPNETDEGSHNIRVDVSDNRQGETSQAWNVEVIKPRQPSSCFLSFAPESPINYAQQPFITRCSCTNPEANAKLWRDGQDVSNENGQPITLAANPTGYDYVCNVSETENYEDASNSSTYIIEKSQTLLNLNAQPGWNIVYGTETTITCSANNNEVVLNLYRNSVPVNNPDTQTLGAGTYNYVCDTSETENWTASSAVNVLNINKGISQVDLLLNGVDNSINILINDPVEMNGTLLMPTSTNPDPDPDDDKIMPVDDKHKILQQRRRQQGQQGPYRVNLYLDNQLIAYGEHNISCTRSFSSAGIHNVTLVYPENENYSSSAETHFITVEEDTETPVVNLVSPADEAVFTIPNVTITYNVTDNLDAMLDCNIWSSTSGTWQIDAQQQTASGSSNSWNYSNLDNGVYVWNIECQDDSGNSGFAPANWMFTINVDYEAPIITFVPPTPSNDSTITVNSTFINTTITDNVAVDSVILEWNGVNETMSESGTNYYVNKTDLNDGIYTYTVYANDTSGNWNVSETRTLTVDTLIPIHDIAIESLDLQKDANSQGINKSIELSTVYLNDTIYVLALIHNLGNVDETNINITLQNNIGIIDSKLINLTADQSNVVVFAWNAYPEGWHTLTVKAEPVQGETDFTNNELSQDAQVWKVCDVIDCSVFGPRTASESYTRGQPFLVRSLIQNLWNNETFKDLRIELDVEQPGLQIIAPWPAVQYIDILAPSQFVAVNWNVTSYNTGNYSITAWAGNREYNATKNIEITQ